MISYSSIRRTQTRCSRCSPLIAGAGILEPDAIVIAEHFKKQPSPESAGGLTLYREARYGDTVLAFYTLKRS